jgi:hypothetical protein
MIKTFSLFDSVLTMGINIRFAEDIKFTKEFLKQLKVTLKTLPETCTDGGNDYDFFSLDVLGEKVFIVRNEIDTHTIMFANEY